MRIHIDQNRCTGHGRCFSLAPDVFDCDEEGFGLINVESVPLELEAAARLCAASCPEHAIVLEPQS
jgi:ferredoxin